MTHALEDFGGRGGAADVPMFVLGVSADYEKVVGGRDAAVTGAGGEHEYVACVYGDGFAAFSAEDEVGVARGKAKDFVRSGVVVVEGVDTVAPLRRPLVGGEEPFHGVG